MELFEVCHKWSSDIRRLKDCCCCCHCDADDFDGPSFHLRLALSGTTSLLIIALLIFMVHRLRQRRLLIVMRRK